jgi:hypothetical protein
LFAGTSTLFSLLIRFGVTNTAKSDDEGERAEEMDRPEADHLEEPA